MRGEKIIIYQLFPRLFGNTRKLNKEWGSISTNGCGKFRDINQTALKSIAGLGVTHIWLTGILRHATGTDYTPFGIPASNPQIIKGKAGSPYAISDYYDLDPDLATDIGDRMKEFDELLDRIHEQGMKVIIDFVPNHVSRDYCSRQKPPGIADLGENDNKSVFFSINNNFYYLPGHELKLPVEPGPAGVFTEIPAKASGNDVFSPEPAMTDWYETVKLNYGINPETGEKQFKPVPDTWRKMLAILQFWSNKKIDGFRCDMAGMVPVEFWSYAIGSIKNSFPGIIFIAEIYEPLRYGDFLHHGGFDYLYDKVGLYDAIRDITTGREGSGAISGIWQSLGGLDKFMLRFLENHDEQRIASPHFAGNAWKGLPGMAVCAMINKGPLMIYNGQEVGEDARGAVGFSRDDGRTSIFDYCSMPEFQKWYNHGACNGGLLSADQEDLRKSYADIIWFCRSHGEISGGFYDLMWQNQDLEDDVKNNIYAFLRYDNNSCILITVCFIPEKISKTTIRIHEHALNLIPAGIKERYFLDSLYPESEDKTLILSQLTGRGIEVNFNRTGWTAIRIS